MYKMRNFDAKYFAFYTRYFESSFALHTIQKMREFINADPQNATTKPPGFCYYAVIYLSIEQCKINYKV